MTISLFTQIWIARILGRAGLGEYHATTLFVSVITTLLFFGLPTAVAQRVSASEEFARAESSRVLGTGLTLAISVGLGIAACSFALAGPFGRLFGLPRLQPGELAIAAFAAAVSWYAANAFIAMFDLKRATLIAIAQPVGVVLAITSSLGGLNFEAPSLAAIGFVTSGALGLVLLANRGVRPCSDWRVVTDIIALAAPATRVTYPAQITSWLDRLAVGVLLGSPALGAFVAANTLVDATQRVAGGIGSIGVSAYARLSTDDVGAERVLDSHLRLLAAAFTVAGAVFIAAGPAMLALLFGSGFVIAATTLRFLAIAALPVVLAIALATHGVGTRLSFPTGLLLLFVLMDVAVTAVATLFFHIAGTAAARVLVWTIGAALFARRAISAGAPVRPRTLLHIAAVAAPVFSASWILALRPMPWPLAAGLALFVAGPPVAVILIGTPERRLLRRVLRRRAD